MSVGGSERIPSDAEAWRAFARWCEEHDPDEELEGIFEAAEAYFEWAQTNSIEKYLDKPSAGDGGS